MSYVVTGATGQVGSAVVDYLLAKSVPVHVIVRSQEKAQSFRSRNIEVTIGDITDGEALKKAFQGAKAVFAMNPPAYEKPDMHVVAAEVGQALATAIKAAKVERVVVLSSVGAEQNAKTGNIFTAHILEDALKESAPQVVMIRAASFTENWIGPALAVKAGHSPVLGSVLQRLDQKLPHVATNDIGRVASEYMMKPKNEVDHLVIVELEGPEPYSPNDIAKIVSDKSRKKCISSCYDRRCDTRIMYQNGAGQNSAADNMVEMSKGFDNDIIRWTTNANVTRIQGKVTAADVLKKTLQ